MTHSEALQDILRTIGVMDYGKERWFAANGVWYDRYDGKYINAEELVTRVLGVLNDWRNECL